MAVVMRATQDRYTDSDLLKMLHIIVSDYNRQPTQREVLADDRLPTHHTYRHRFGTLASALNIAGLGAVPKVKSPTHDTIAECVRHLPNVQLVGEWVLVGSIVADFEVRVGERTYLIDLIDLKGYVDDDLLQSIVRLRRRIADAHAGNRQYIAVSNPIEAVHTIDKIQ